MRVRFSPDGRRLATVSAESVKLWDAQTGQEQLTCRDPHGNLQEVVFSTDGRRLAAVGGRFAVHPDREIKVWDAQTGREVLSLRGHVGGLMDVAFSPDGRRLASTGLDQSIKIWDVATGQEVLTLRGHLDDVFCLVFSPDGHRLASASFDKTVRDLGRQSPGGGAGPGIPDPPRPYGRLSPTWPSTPPMGAPWLPPVRMGRSGCGTSGAASRSAPSRGPRLPSG